MDTPGIWWRRIGVGVVMGGLALLAVSRSDEVAPRSATAEAAQWLRATNSPLPTTLATLAPHPMPRRKALYGQLSMAQREALWREQLASFVESESELSPLQLEIRRSVPGLTAAQVNQIRHAMARLSEVFDPTSPVERRQAVANELCAYNKTAFTRQQAVSIFGTLGLASAGSSADSTRSISRASAIDIPGGTALLRVAGEKLGVVKAAPCNCHVGSWCTCESCGSRGCTLDPLDSDQLNCGCLWSFVCNGLC